LVVEGGDDAWSAAELAAAVPGLSAIWHRSGRGLAPPRLLEGEFDEGGPAFSQVNPEVAEDMKAHVVAVAGEGGTAVDAYCGAGLYGRALAEQGRTVTGIERDPAACEEATSGAPGGFSVVQGPVESELARVLPTDLLIVNPPRMGLDADVVRAVLDAPPGRLIYVSCDPATLARDLAALTDVYELEALRCFDLFPQTAHVETVAVLTRRGAGS
jgi:tRNA/tmRNA/rRNA uracil-C5-methylase (TrmA/RlmC/RlmD family)